VEDTPR